MDGPPRAIELRDRADRDLLTAMARGDEDGLRELYRRYSGIAFGLASRIAKDRAIAEDVVQEVFVAVWKGATGFDEARGSVRGWILTQIHHRCVDHIRREESARRRNVTLTLFDPDREPPAADAIVEEEWIALRRTQVRAAIETLSVEQRQMLELAYFNGMTQREIADQTGTPLGTVKSRTITALRLLRSRLSGEFASEDV